MQTSEEQFQELMAHLMARANRALSQQSLVPPMSLLLGKDGELSLAVGAADTPSDLEQTLDAMRESMREQVKASVVLATCIAYTDRDTGSVVALLENHENYCATVRIAVKGGTKRELDAENIEIDDGSVHVFPVDGRGAR